MGTTDGFRTGPGRTRPAWDEAGSLLDVLSVAAVVLDREGRIILWSPQAQDLFGWTPAEALGQYAAKLLVAEEDLAVVLDLFDRVMGEGESWAGVFPVRHKDGGPRLVELRNVRLEGPHGSMYALGIATDREVLRDLERDLALSLRLVAQSPIGLAVLDTDLRYVMVNPALERIHGFSAEEHLGRRIGEVLPFVDVEESEATMRRVLATGEPELDRFVAGGIGGGEDDRARLVSYYRLEDAGGHILGVAASVVDVTDRYRADLAAAEARRRLALIADASVLIGTTLDLDQTAHELAEVVVPALADVAAVDVLDAALEGNRAPQGRATAIRALAVASAGTAGAVDAARAADPVGELAHYPADRLVAECVATGHPVHLPRVGTRDLPRIARDGTAAALLARAGLHSYIAVPLIARGEVLGALDLKRTDNPAPFTEDDVVLAGELAARAAVCIDNARWYQRERAAVLSLQRTLLPQRPPSPPGLEVAYRYQPAGAAGQVGGDWFDVVPQDGGKSALVVGDVMGSGITAAAAMGQLRTAARTLSGLGLDPAQVLRHLDRAATGLDQQIATCVYAVFDPEGGRCCVANAGHLPPVLLRDGGPPVLLDLPTGAPLGVGGVPFESVAVDLAPGDRLVLYTDGLVETRDEALDVRLAELVRVLDAPRTGLEETCDLLLSVFREGSDDDVALLIAEVGGREGAGR
ncbi:SpoIIE family protein phosphatase [Streptomyces mobaraensis NBRC 13819 = DSM 40847]|uniref:protein-serine/threonine phosphatase n=1 Tax=Streptomyces mobaraensis (strain ATCC 29032 / DSM 40847 / JCM 4168 / NBRC 13819 / NCIMB 11159 / IPCR 16-22) TaxID=1223523 RepID=M3BP98_STRM1|nr:SpoIIE family protein phosphatase [Streptomyces mobaraensis]EMF01470.1 magnesium or manganese-dependent protein phosphatase [Streptomyces mobaraensis NBRC 13819 = DSM 40847]QTT76798.1 SpoIIE family protein phosphatase [Streptomyces mobaraensis NBRC 13819 = DSM 40847]